MLAWLDQETISLLSVGLRFTIGLTVVTTILSMILGVSVGTMRLSQKRWQRWLGGLHVEIHRNIPALVLILFWAFAVPNLFPADLRQQIFFDNGLISALKEITGLPLVYYGLAASLALTLNTSAYIGELFRAGVGTIPQEHVDMARTLGASTWEIYRKLLLPQGLRTAMPAISTRLIHNMKNTSLAAFVSVPELFHSTQSAITLSFRAMELLLIAAGIYLALSVICSLGLRLLEKRVETPKRVPAQALFDTKSWVEQRA